MSDNALNYFASAGTAAEMALHTPDPPVPAAGPDYGVRWFQTDTGLTFEWDGAVWVQVSGTGIGTVTNTGTLASGAIVKGNGGVDVSTTTTGTGILTALGNNIGSAGAPVVFNGALGTPSSGTLTSCTLPVGGVTGLGSGVATFLATPSSANLASALTDETGSGANVFAISPTLVTPFLGTPTSGTLTNCVGAIAQILNTQTGASATGTTLIPTDDTIPQNTEGDQYMTLAITPTNVASILRIEVVALATSSVATTLVAALFQDTTADALAAAATYQNIGTGFVNFSFSYKMAAGTTSATTFKVRIGAGNAGTVTFNGAAGGRFFGGVLNSSITITEYR